MKRWLVVGLMLLAGVAQAQETTSGEYSELEKLIQSFRDADVRGDLVVTADPEVVSPFGGPSQLPGETTGPATLNGTLSGLINPSGTPVLTPPGAVFDGRYPPAPLDAQVRGFDPIMSESIDRLPPLASAGLTRADVDAILGTPTLAGIFRTAGTGDPFSGGGPVVVDGGVVAAPIPLDCPGHIMEYGRVDLIEGQPEWSGFAENDLFNGGSQAIVTRCVDGQWELERLVNQGEQFVAMPTDAFTVVFEEGWLTFIPYDEVLGSMGSRSFGFVTTLDNPFQPETTGATATPFPGLAEPAYLLLVNDPESLLPGPPVFSQPAVLEYGDGTCSPDSFQSLFELFVLADGSPQIFIEQLSTGQVVSGTPTLSPDGTITYALDGSGPGYTEHYEWSGPAGTYQHTNSATCSWTVTMDPQVSEALEEAVTLSAQPETTTTSSTPATTTTVTATTTTTAAAGEAPIEVTGSPVWPWILIGLGLAGLGLGIFLLGSKGPCDELRKAWEAAERRRKSAQEGLDQARRYLEERRKRVSAVEAELSALEKSAQSSVTEHGVTYHLIEGGRVTSEGLQSVTANARSDLADAQAAQADAEASVKEWEDRVAEAAKAADEAKAAYERCVGEHTPKTPEPGQPEPEPGGPAVATPPPPTETPECREGDREVRSAGNADTINVTVDFSLFVEVIEGTERQVDAGKTLALDLSDLANELGALGSMLGAYGSGRSTGQGVMGMAAGKYTAGGGKLIRGGVEGYIAGADPNIGTESFPISIPTSPQEVVTEFWEGTARLGSIIAGKVSEWLEMNQLYRVRMTYFYQSMTAVPHQVWVCRGGRWVCEETIYEITIGSLQRRPGPEQGPFRLESDIARHGMEREIDRMTARARSELRDSARRKAEFEQAHQPGPCQ